MAAYPSLGTANELLLTLPPPLDPRKSNMHTTMPQGKLIESATKKGYVRHGNRIKI